MRLALRIDPGTTAPYAAICTAIALFIALPAPVCAQQAGLAQSAMVADSADTGSATLVTSQASTMSAPDSAALVDGPLAAPALGITADAFVNDFSLDDQMLSRQRGGAVGMLMVAATPQLMRGSSGSTVTLWDEIAPPAQLPIPVDAARAAQGNVASYQRK
ncbi:hypothetical protein P3T18_004976 [Paraburkholderia sp. GAS199]|uniref:hypothetical protein n=1 Tax=Paraburkholderia sp. GAS199 TaxID=3035126 RepID=UPI003D1C4BFC